MWLNCSHSINTSYNTAHTLSTRFATLFTHHRHIWQHCSHTPLTHLPHCAHSINSFRNTVYIWQGNAHSTRTFVLTTVIPSTHLATLITPKQHILQYNTFLQTAHAPLAHLTTLQILHQHIRLHCLTCINRTHTPSTHLAILLSSH